MRRSGSPLVTFLFLLASAALLSGCGSGEIRRIFPPQASIQQLDVESDGSWTLQVRIQNFSTVGMRFDRVQATLRLGDVEAGRIDIAPEMGIGRFAADVVEARLVPSQAASDRVVAALTSRGSVRYRLEGRIATGEPDRRDFPFEFDSLLNPVPGLEGTLR
ncbi:LEA type 2 family protein [Coralloluteibacterium thermophilus]|uniref:LEA type 2 family protein n=1 Tax=Coralloluteibacterium thermophilum TaxID=2707049 RepID=A0ABV9NPD7_9GAMM